MNEREYRSLAEFRYQIRRFLHFSEKAAQAEGLESQQHQFLLAVQAESHPEAPTVGRIAERLLIHHHSAVGLADRLQGRGLVERIRGEGDRRQVRLRLTAEGAAVLQRLTAIHTRELHQSGPELVSALRTLLEGALRQDDRTVHQTEERDA